MIITRGFLTEELDVDLLKRVDTAELVQLVVDLVENERLVVVGSVVLHYVIHWEEGEIQHEDGRDSPHPRTQRRSLPGALQQTRGQWRGGGSGPRGRGWAGGGARQAHTCVWDQEVHHLDSVEVDHHTTAVGRGTDTAVRAKLWNMVPLLGGSGRCVTRRERRRVHGGGGVGGGERSEAGGSPGRSPSEPLVRTQPREKSHLLKIPPRREKRNFGGKTRVVHLL